MSRSSEAFDDEDATGSSDPCCGGHEEIPGALVAEDVTLLSAMGNDTRYELLRLIGAEDEGTCVCELDRAVGVSQSAVSQALSRLYEAGLVSRRKEGTWRYYETTDRAETLLNALDEIRTEDSNHE